MPLDSVLIDRIVSFYVVSALSLIDGLLLLSKQFILKWGLAWHLTFVGGVGICWECCWHAITAIFLN
jgi:hypothetical protein